MSSPTSELERLLKQQIVRAGAGAGKTTQLSDRVISVASTFYSERKRLPKILVTTFTRKATQELKERLVALACQKKSPELLQFVSSPSYLYISTIHGVLSLFLKRYGPIFGIDPSFQFLDEASAAALHKATFRDSFTQVNARRPEASELLEFYTTQELIRIFNDLDNIRREQPSSQPFQLQDFQTCFENLLRSTKETGIDIFSQVATSDKPSWAEYADKMIQVLSSEVESFAELSQAIKSRGRKPPYTKANPPIDESLNLELEEWLKGVHKRAEKLSLDPATYSVTSHYLNLINEAALEYSDVLLQKKTAQNSYEIRDIELMTSQLVAKDDALAEHFSGDWDYVLIDEYQDTSPLQVRILDALLRRVASYYVGDPQQSIYLFRGARSEVFNQKQDEIVAAGGDLSVLQKNYRSRPELLEFINDQTRVLGPQFSQMIPKEETFENSEPVAVVAPVPEDANEPYLPIVRFIAEQVAAKRFDDFAVLTRKNHEALEISRYLESKGIPTQVHSASGFFQTREVLDALSLLRFLVFPYDSENLALLARTPWFKISDEVLADWIQSEQSRLDWDLFLRRGGEDPSVQKLKKLLERSQEAGVFTTWIEGLSGSGFLDFSLYYDPTGRRESNIWKLIELVRENQRKSGFSFAHFLEQTRLGVESFDEEEGEAIAVIEPNRVNIMTVHKSKGLKFNQVILPNMHKGPKTVLQYRSHKSLVVFDEEQKKWGLQLPFGEDNKKEDLLPCMQSLEKFSLRELEENSRLYYVALTRAVEKVLLTWVGEPQPQSWALWIPDERKLVDTKKNEKYKLEYWEAPYQSPLVTLDRVRKLDVRKPYLDSSESEPIRSRSRLSVSTLLENYATENVAADRAVTAGPDSRNLESRLLIPEFGVRLHAALERLKYSWTSPVDFLAAQSSNPAGFLKAVQFVKELSSPNIQSILESGEVEWGFQMKTAQGVIEGQIDLWGEWQDRIWVIDYKSGHPKYIEKAFAQLEVYAYALSRYRPEKPISMAVIYPLLARVETKDLLQVTKIGQKYGF